MPKDSRDDLRFDLGRATVTLHQEALNFGVVPADHPRATDVLFVARAHSHSIEHNGGCEKAPCRAAGLCLALNELLQHRSERELFGPILAASSASADAKGWLDAGGRELHDALGRLLPGSSSPVTVSPLPTVSIAFERRLPPHREGVAPVPDVGVRSPVSSSRALR
jgi:hypothetical protein